MKIPQYLSQEPLQVPNVNPQIATMPYNAQAQFGAGLAELGQNFLEQEIKIQEGKKKVDRALAVQGGIDEYRSKMTDLDSVLQKTGDPDYLSKMQAGSAKTMAEIFGKTKDPEVLSHLKIKLSDVSTDTYLKAKSHDNLRFLSTTEGDVDLKLYNKSKEIAEATSDEERIKLGGEGVGLINELAPVLGEKWAAEKKIAFDKGNVSEMKKATTRKAFNEVMQNPDNVDDIIQKYNLPEEQQGELRKQGEIEKDRIFRHQEQARVEENRKIGDDFFKKISEPEKYGVLTIPEINSSTLPLSEKNYFLKIFENSVKPKKAVTDPAFATRLLDNILSDRTRGVRETILSEMSKDPDSDNPPRLNTQQGEMLLRAYYGKTNKETGHYTSDPWFSLTKSYFREQLGIKEEEGIDQAVERMIKGGAKPSSKNMQHYYSATVDLMKAVEGGNLKGDAIWKKGQEILATTMAGMKGKKDQFGYEIGEQRPKNGIPYRYIGNDQWQRVR